MSRASKDFKFTDKNDVCIKEKNVSARVHTWCSIVFAWGQQALQVSRDLQLCSEDSRENPPKLRQLFAYWRQYVHVEDVWNVFKTCKISFGKPADEHKAVKPIVIASGVWVAVADEYFRDCNYWRIYFESSLSFRTAFSKRRVGALPFSVKADTLIYSILQTKMRALWAGEGCSCCWSHDISSPYRPHNSVPQDVRKQGKQGCFRSSIIIKISAWPWIMVILLPKFNDILLCTSTLNRN